MTNKIVAVFFLLFLFVGGISQSRNITGIIKDDKGNPVSYAVIQIKGTNKGVNSDSLGVFVINIKPNRIGKIARRNISAICC